MTLLRRCVLAEEELMAGEPLLRGNLACLVFVEEHEPPSTLKEFVESSKAEALEIAKAADLPVLQLNGEEMRALVADDAVTDRIAELKRRVILLAGGELEGAVTQIALSALVDGFDVFIAADLVWTAEPGREQLFLNRMTATCGVVLTRRQILLELTAYERDEERKKKLQDLLASAAG